VHAPDFLPGSRVEGQEQPLAGFVVHRQVDASVVDDGRGRRTDVVQFGRSKDVGLAFASQRFRPCHGR